MTPSDENFTEWLPPAPKGCFWHLMTTRFGTKLYLKKKTRVFFGLIPFESTIADIYLAPEVSGWEVAVKNAARRALDQVRFSTNLNLKVEKN